MKTLLGSFMLLGSCLVLAMEPILQTSVQGSYPEGGHRFLKQQEKTESSSSILRCKARTKANARDAAEPTISGRLQLQGFGQRCSMTVQPQSAVFIEPRVSNVAREHDRGHLTGEISSQNVNKDILSPCDALAFICVIRNTAYYM